MKKRIGTKLYDTDTSERIADVGVGILYRKQTRGREWFLEIGDNIESLTEPEARALLGDTVRIERPQSDAVMVRVDRETHNVIAQKAKMLGISMTEAIRRIVLGI